MVGDRAYDIESAAAEGIPAVHVRWGYGGPAESAGAVACVAEPAELAQLVDLLHHTETAETEDEHA